MNLSLSSQELSQSKNDEEVVRQTAEQVIKDFALFGYPITFPVNIHLAYNQLYNQLQECIIELLDENGTKLYDLLYRIDVSEFQIKKEIKNNPEKEQYQIITELILDRELKKVLTRRYFSQTGNTGIQKSEE